MGQRRRGQPPPYPLEKHNAKRGLQRGNLTAKRRLCLAQNPRGGGERAGFQHRQKGAGLIPVKGEGLPIHAFLHNRNAEIGNSKGTGA